MKRLYLMLLVATATIIVQAAAPNGSGNYYSSANGKNGEALKTALCGIIYKSPLGSYSGLWTAFQSTDVDSNGKIWDMYSNITHYECGGSAQGANYKKEGDSYNREHSFPQSWFGSSTPMYTDLHHIYPTDGFVNSKRSNYPFGETAGGSYKSANSFSKLGACTISGYSGTVFEPADEYKGDFARTYFYMVTCYENQIVSWYNNYSNTEVTAVLDGNKYPGLQIWQLNMLLRWAAEDPVSEKEIARNTAVKNIQGNRNPFIDYPGLEQYIWGSCKDVAFDYDDYAEPSTYSTEYNSGSGSGSGSGQGQGGSGSGTGEDKTITLTYDSFGLTTSYAVKTATVDSYGFTVNQGYKGTGDVIQMNSSKGAGILYNTTAIPGLKSITVNVSSGNKTYTITTGTSQNPTANSQTGTTGGTYNVVNGDTYFQLSVSGASYFSSIVITYNDSGSGGSTTTDPSYNLTDLNVNYGSTLTLTKGTSGTENIVTDGTVTLTSSNTSVVTVSGLTITPHAVGTAIITINAAASENYNAGSTMAEITVNAPEGQTTAAPSTGGGMNITLFGESFGDNSGSARDWSNDYSVKSGVAAVYSGITGYTITNAKQSKNTVGSTASGLMQTTTGTDASIIIGPLNVADYYDLSLTYQWKAGSIKGTYSSTAYYATSSTGSYTELTGAGAGATTFVERSYSLPAAAQVSTLYLKIVWNTSNTNAIIDEVQLNGSSAATPATFDVTLNSYGYATYCSEYPLDFSDYATADYTAWYITGINGSAITFSQITGSVKGGTGLFLMGTPNATVTLTSVASSNELSGNLLKGTLAPTYVGAGEVYGLKNNQFVPSSSAGTISAGKAYLDAEDVPDVSEAKALIFVFEDTTTGIEAIHSEDSSMNNGQWTMDNAKIFNLAGQRLDNAQFKMHNSQLRKGIYIVNGKKVLVK